MMSHLTVSGEVQWVGHRLRLCQLSPRRTTEVSLSTTAWDFPSIQNVYSCTPALPSVLTSSEEVLAAMNPLLDTSLLFQEILEPCLYSTASYITKTILYELSSNCRFRELCTNIYKFDGWPIPICTNNQGWSPVRVKDFTVWDFCLSKPVQGFWVEVYPYSRAHFPLIITLFHNH